MACQWQSRGIDPPAMKPGENWLFLVPHDDDVVIGAGLAIQAALDASANVTVAVSTDGGNGYCDLEDKDRIAGIREAETRDSMAILGDLDLRFLGFPDGSLSLWQGRRRDGGAFDGGLEGAFTRLFRSVRPDYVVFCSDADLHPDHKIVAEELLISLFHAIGDIWPELGAPMPKFPQVLEYPVYCALVHEPNLRLVGDAESFEKKLRSIAAYKSQRQIEALVEKVREGGPQEFFRQIEFDLYSPLKYQKLFEEEGV